MQNSQFYNSDEKNANSSKVFDLATLSFRFVPFHSRMILLH